jgi:hypothetical protein
MRYGVSQVRANNRRSAPFVNAQFIARKARFLYDLRDIVRKITDQQPLILQGKQTFLIFLAESC